MIRRMFAVLILAALVTVLACGGGGDQLTAREYAEACGELEGLNFDLSLGSGGLGFDDSDDPEEEIGAIRDFIQEYKRLNPPDSLQDLHDARLEFMDFMDDKLLPLVDDLIPLAEDAMSAREDGDEDELERIEEEAQEILYQFENLQDEMVELAEAEAEEFGSLSSRNQEILEDADCG